MFAEPVPKELNVIQNSDWADFVTVAVKQVHIVLTFVSVYSKRAANTTHKYRQPNGNLDNNK